MASHTPQLQLLSAAALERLKSVLRLISELEAAEHRDSQVLDDPELIREFQARYKESVRELAYQLQSLADALPDGSYGPYDPEAGWMIH